MNPDLAIDYVRENGDQFAQARLAYLLYQDSPPDEVLMILLAGQRPDGSWPPVWAANYGSLDATCYRIAQAHQIGLTGSDVPLVRGCGFLACRQRANGSWEEAKEMAAAAPEWLKPGRRSARLFLTANCGVWLSILGGAQSEALKAARYLHKYLGEGQGLPSYLQTQWLAASLFYRLKWLPDAERLLSYLEVRLGELPPGSLGWMLISLVNADLPRDHQLFNAGVDLLERLQLVDGSWQGDGTPMGNIRTTLEVMTVLRFCGRL